MIRIRRSDDRGQAKRGWLDSHHTFSFAQYYDPEHMGFRDLRVINDDVVHPGQGFGKHSHRDMEIISYVVDGALEHKDNLGTGSVLRPGDVQRMSAGRGVIHSEFNHSQDDSVRFLQIWVLPEEEGIDPSYEERRFPEEEKRGRLRLLVSPDGADDSLRVHQDMKLYGSVLEAGDQVTHELGADRHAWVQVVGGRLTLNGETLEPGDGAAISETERLELEGVEKAEILLFDLN